MGLILSYAASVAAFLKRELQGGPAARRRLPEGTARGNRTVLAGLLLLPSLSACGSLGQATSAAAVPAAPNDSALSAAAVSPAAPFVAGPNDLLYVANAGNNSITVYHTQASGDTAPIATIAGSKTGLDGPGQLSEDASGDLYVANEGLSGSSPSAILVFKHGANGNVAPIRVITGPLTGLSTYVYAATVDPTSGEIFAVAQVASGGGGVSKFIRFSPNATGNAAPLATSQNTDSARELAFDSSGKHIINASTGCCENSATFGVYTYEKQFPNGANLSPIYTIDSFYTAGIADDPTTKTYLASTGGTPFGGEGIFRFDEDTVGHGATQGGSSHFSPHVVSVIKSDTCGGQLALGYERNIYVAHSTQDCPTDAVYVYEHDASGNATPLRILTGSATKLDQPTGIYEGK